MEHLITPAGYKPVLDLRETQVAIKEIKDFFQRELAKQLNLTRVSAPLFVLPESGLNDNLNGVERPVQSTSPQFRERPLRSYIPSQNGNVWH